MTVDGTLLEAWASQKSFMPKDGSGNGPDAGGDVDFRGQKRKNDTHESKTDPEARLLRKGPGKEAKLCFGGHALMENRNGMLVDILVADGLLTETQAAIKMIMDLGRNQSYKISQIIRKRVEEIFGWTKTFGGLAKSRFVGIEKNQISAHIVGAAYNLIRMSRLVPAV